MTTAGGGGDPSEYRRRIRAWVLYDWANSAFATTILAAVLPVYYKSVAAATLPSTEVTRFWTLTLSVSLAIVAVFAPVLGTVADVARCKKRLLGFFVVMGVAGTALLAFVSYGQWLLASLFFVIGRVGFASANVFYDSLLPHVARPADQDRVSSQGYAIGYLGGGILLGLNVVMLLTLPETIRYAAVFLSVAVWWGAFSLPLFRRVPEPPAAGVPPGAGVLMSSYRRLAGTFRHLRRYRQLFRFLIAFLIYNDGIGTIIGVAAIYGAELGFGAFELILAILLVQFVGIPFSLVFGGIATAGERHRAAFLAFVVANVILLPLVGVLAARMLPGDAVGAAPPPFLATEGHAGQGVALDQFELDDGGRLSLPYHGQGVRITFTGGPDYGSGRVRIGDVRLDLDARREVVEYRQSEVIDPGTAGEHELILTASGDRFFIERIEVLPPDRESDLPLIFGLLIGVQVLSGLFAVTVGRRLFAGLASRMSAKRTIILALATYALVALWGFRLDAVIEFWFLAFMIAVVQGGSQALSRSLYAAMSPAALSGEFFGFFSVMAKFSAIAGPLLFVASIDWFGGSRPALLGVMCFFILGLLLMTRVDVDEGSRVAREADEAAFGKDSHGD